MERHWRRRRERCNPRQGKEEEILKSTVGSKVGVQKLKVC